LGLRGYHIFKQYCSPATSPKQENHFFHHSFEAMTVKEKEVHCVKCGEVNRLAQQAAHGRIECKACGETLRNPFLVARVLQSTTGRVVGWCLWVLAVGWAVYLIGNNETEGRRPVSLRETPSSWGEPEYLPGQEYLKFPANFLFDDLPSMTTSKEKETTLRALKGRMTPQKQPDQVLQPAWLTALLALGLLVGLFYGLAAMMWGLIWIRSAEHRTLNVAGRFVRCAVFCAALVVGTHLQVWLAIDNATEDACEVSIRGRTFTLPAHSFVELWTMRGSHHLRVTSRGGAVVFDDRLDVSADSFGDKKWRLINLGSKNAYALVVSKYVQIPDSWKK
jgi:hypothetical protein